MRLTCPNCAARYRVEAADIPPAGREVQCSNCGQAWFQRPESGPAPAPAPSGQTPADTAEEAEEAAPPPDTAPPRREIDDAVLAVLREEASRETAARKAELLGARQPPGAARDRPARPGLTDIEQINTNLRGRPRRPAAPPEARAAPTPEEESPPPRRRRRGGGFLTGFILAAVVVAAAAVVYARAPAIADTAPRAAPALARYVEAVDGLRRQLDSVALRVAGYASGLARGGSGG